MTHDPKSLLALGCRCRLLSAGVAIEANRLAMEAEAVGRAPCPMALDMAAAAFALHEAAEHLQHDAQDTDLLSWIAHRAAGGDIILAPLPVVVGDAQGTAPPANDVAGPRLFGRLRRLISGRA